MNQPGQPPSLVKPVRRLLALREWTLQGLAEEVKMKVPTLVNLLCGNHQSEMARHRVEVALGAPLWLSPEQFAARQALARYYGQDLYVMKQAELHALALRRLRPAGWYSGRIRSAASLRQRLEEFAAQHGRPTLAEDSSQAAIAQRLAVDLADKGWTLGEERRRSDPLGVELARQAMAERGAKAGKTLLPDLEELRLKNTVGRLEGIMAGDLEPFYLTNAQKEELELARTALRARRAVRGEVDVADLQRREREAKEKAGIY